MTHPKNVRLAFAAMTAAGALSVPAYAQTQPSTDNEMQETVSATTFDITADINYSDYTLPEMADNTEENPESYQRLQPVQDVFVRVGSRNGLYWQEEGSNLQIGAYFRSSRGARDGQIYTGDPKAQPRDEYTIDVRYRF